jgi:hypothetical protein
MSSAEPFRITLTFVLAESTQVSLDLRDSASNFVLDSFDTAINGNSNGKTVSNEMAQTGIDLLSTVRK